MGQMLSWPDVSDKPLSSTDIVGTVVAMSYVLVILFWLLFVCFYSCYIDHRDPINTVTNYAASRSTGTESPPVRHIIFEIVNVNEETDSAAEKPISAPEHVALDLQEDYFLE